MKRLRSFWRYTIRRQARPSMQWIVTDIFDGSGGEMWFSKDSVILVTSARTTLTDATSMPISWLEL